jgi:hypothetical protein
VNVDRRPRAASEPAVAGDVVSVVVGLQHVLDADVVQAPELEVRLDIPLRVDDDRDPLAGVGDEIRGAAEVLVEDLPEQHRD